MKKLKGVDVSEWQGQIDWDAVKRMKLILQFFAVAME